MKNTFTFLFALLISLVVFSQVPEKFNYQAVVRDNSGNPVPNQSVSFRMSILEDNISGTPVFTETHIVTTNQFGVVSFEVGTGVVSLGSFSAIDWGSHSYFLQVELDISGGSYYTLMGTTQMMSVPYALYARQADLHVTSMLKYTPEPKSGVCDLTLEGNMYYDEFFKEYCFCDGSNWKQVDGGGYCDCMDLDDDGFDNCGIAHPYDTDGLAGDCDDSNPNIRPGAGELCNNIDDDCDGIIDNNPVSGPIFYQDFDSDGWGNQSVSIIACFVPAGYTLNSGDCDDNDPAIRPFAAELCDNIDNDCDGMVDELPVDGILWFPDFDLDGYGNSGAGVMACDMPEPGFISTGGDCDDSNPNVFPGAVEVCDFQDNDCNGMFDENPVDGIQFYYDNDSDGYGDQPYFERLCENPQPSLFVIINGDCDDNNFNINPGVLEVCDGIDNNCDGQVDEGGFADSDNDGIADCYEFNFGDTDQDGTDDYLDNDDDNDGIITGSQPKEGLDDIDFDGFQNYRDNDDDGDNVLTMDDNCPYHYNPDQSDFNNDGIGDACQCPPGTQADAGPSQTVNPGTVITLQGNLPSQTTGVWTIFSGFNGIIDEPTNPNSTFTGEPCTEYELQWELTSLCGITASSTIIAFIGAEPPFANAGTDQIVYGGIGTQFGVSLSASPISSGFAGTWAIESGTGGLINDVNSPTTSFEGIIGEIYVLSWTVSNGCLEDINNVSIKSFANVPDCGLPLLDTRDNQTYNTVQIGSQCWMAKNLNIGVIVAEATGSASNNLIIEKFCFEDNPFNCNGYGGLYNWDEMMQYSNLEGAQGICPSGWHLPTDNEWKILEGTVDSQSGIGSSVWDGILFRGLDAGHNLKSADFWNGNNLFGFSALPGGGFDPSFGGWTGLGVGAAFWTSTGLTAGAMYRGLDESSSSVSRFNFPKTSLMSVRCVKNGPVN